MNITYVLERLDKEAEDYAGSDHGNAMFEAAQLIRAAYPADSLDDLLDDMLDEESEEGL